MQRANLLGCRRVCFRELAAEALDASGCVDHLLLAGEEWVASCADLDIDVALVCGARLKLGAASALYIDFAVTWVNSRFCHDCCEPFLQSVHAIAPFR